MVIDKLRAVLILLYGCILVACGNGGNGIGPNPALLYGTWAQDGLAQADPDMIVDQAVVAYRPDGTSTFTAMMTVRLPDTLPILFDIKVDVNWSLDETVVTRTLETVTVTPREPSSDMDAFARQLEAAYRASPPGRLIVQYADANELVFLDPDTGALLRYLNTETVRPD
ncbi:MAG: hypothetical protein AAF926_02240 [Pseudomonadota bacterium]